jgi:hypothetical protein
MTNFTIETMVAMRNKILSKSALLDRLGHPQFPKKPRRERRRSGVFGIMVPRA